MTDELDAYDAFLEGLAREAGPTADHRLWRVTKPGREIACFVREIRTGHGFVALELCILQF
jgi:hypothetical protein